MLDTVQMAVNRMEQVANSQVVNQQKEVRDKVLQAVSCLAETVGNGRGCEV